MTFKLHGCLKWSWFGDMVALFALGKHPGNLATGLTESELLLVLWMKECPGQCERCDNVVASIISIAAALDDAISTNWPWSYMLPLITEDLECCRQARKLDAGSRSSC